MLALLACISHSCTICFFVQQFHFPGKTNRPNKHTKKILPNKFTGIYRKRRLVRVLTPLSPLSEESPQILKQWVQEKVCSGREICFCISSWGSREFWKATKMHFPRKNSFGSCVLFWSIWQEEQRVARTHRVRSEGEGTCAKVTSPAVAMAAFTAGI